MKLDKQTAEEIREGKEWERFVEGEGWQRAKNLLIQKLSVIDSLTQLPEDGDLIHELKARQGAILLVLEWIKEVEGKAQQSMNNNELMVEQRKDDMVRYH